MDMSEIHFLTYDPDEIYKEMLAAYVENGGDILYPGDEKEILLRSVQSILVQAFAGVDHALRMSTLQYAAGDYLDLIGQKRNCPRLEAKAAKATVHFEFYTSLGRGGILAAGTKITADGVTIYTTDEDILYGGRQEIHRVGITAVQPGSAGNSLRRMQKLQMVNPPDGIAYLNVEMIVCDDNASGGMDRETDEAYRERIRTTGLAGNTTGPKAVYEAAAKAVSTDVVDADAHLGGAPGTVEVTVLPASDTGWATLREQIYAALNADTVRPLTDTVTVMEALRVSYVLLYKCVIPRSTSAVAVQEAAESYKTWQNTKIGRAFNPDKLVAMLYQAGCERVTMKEESFFQYGPVQYTQLTNMEYCSGNVQIEVVNA